MTFLEGHFIPCDNWVALGSSQNLEFLEIKVAKTGGTAIVNHPLRQQVDGRLSYFPYIFYFVNFTISAAREPC